MLYRKVPKGTNWFYTLGSATLFAFIVQAVTGVFLAMFYTPSTTQAYASIAHINNEVPLGALVHGMHKWGSSVMVILIFLHMGRTFFFGAYKYPRELNWVIGVVLLILTMTMAFTGYLLPFDQRSFWASVVGININGTGPIVGPYLSDFLRAGPELGATTLSRFYAIHMLLLPGAIIALIGAHLYLVVKLGTTAPPWVRAEKPKVAAPVSAARRRRREQRPRQRSRAHPMKPQDKQAYLEEYELLKKKGKPFFPYAVLKDSAMALIVVAVIIAMSLILGAEQGPKADPTSTTYVPRPEWYFFFLFEVLRVIKPPELVPIATIGIPTICMVLLLLLPFYDRGPERRPERRPIATTAGVPDDRRDGLPHLPRRDRRLADRDRDGGGAAVRGRQGGRRRRRLPRLPQDRRERQPRSGAGPDPHRRAGAAGGDHALGRNRAGHHALLPRPAAEKAQRAGRLPLLARLSAQAAHLGAAWSRSVAPLRSHPLTCARHAGRVP